jgi:hypothetical protein
MSQTRLPEDRDEYFAAEMTKDSGSARRLVGGKVGVIEQSPESDTQDVPVYRQTSSLASEGSEDVRDRMQAIARKARDGFRDACSTIDGDTAELNYIACRDALGALWEHAHLRDVPFRDLLAALSAAVNHTEFADFDESQRDVLRTAFTDLPRWLIEQAIVIEHLERFADHGVDILGPIRSQPKIAYRVVIEEID